MLLNCGVTNLRITGCGRLKSMVCWVTYLRGAGGFKSAGCRKFQKVRDAASSKKCGVWELETSLQFITALMTNLKLSQDDQVALKREVILIFIHSFYVDLEVRWREIWS